MSRSAPPRVPPIVHQGVRYEQEFGNRVIPGLHRDGMISRHLLAIDVATDRLLWHVEVFADPLIGFLERDVQEIYFNSMELIPGRDELLIVREHCSDLRIVVLSTRQVVTPSGH